MGERLSPSVLARLAGIFFAFSGAVAMGTALLGSERMSDAELGFAVGAAAFAVGVGTWLFPWDRVPRSWIFSLVVIALALKAAGNVGRGGDPYTYVVHYLILYMWLGLALPRGSSLLSSPLLIASYVFPLWWLEVGLGAISSALLAVPACVFTGEAAGWLSENLSRAERESESRNVRMRSLVDATFALASCEEPDELASLAAVAACEIHGAPGARVLLRGEGGDLRIAADASWPDASDEPLPPETTELLEKLLADVDASREAELRPRLAASLAVPDLEVLPLRGSARALGVIVIALRAKRAADPFTRYVGRMLATQAALGFERVWASERLRDESLRDPLTRAGNRRKAVAALETLKPGDSIVLIDLDHFKAVNDSYGHAAGDRVLRALADFLRDSLREPDEVFRFGGEEFLILLHGSGAEAGEVMRRLQRSWKAQRRVTTFSAGAAVHRDGEASDRTLARADALLYEAKRRGRDRVVTESDAPEVGAQEPDA